MTSMLETKEGWMSERGPGTRVYHYIRDTFALCRGLGFYTGDLVPATPNTPRGNEDCARCHRLLASEHRRRGRAP